MIERPRPHDRLAGGDLLDGTWPGASLVVELDGRYNWWDVTRRAAMAADEVGRIQRLRP